MMGIGGRIPLNISCLILCLSFFVLLSSGDLLWALFDAFLSPLGGNRLMRSVSELAKPYGSSWNLWFGPFFIAISIGWAILGWRLSISSGINPGIGVPLLCIMISGIMFTSSGRKLPYSAESGLGTYLFLSFLILGVTIFLILAIRGRGDIERDFLFLMIWFILMLLATRGAVRFLLFLSPPAVIIGCLGTIWLYRRLSPGWVEKGILLLIPLWEVYAVKGGTYGLVIALGGTASAFLVGSWRRFREPGLVLCLLITSFLIYQTSWGDGYLKRGRITAMIYGQGPDPSIIHALRWMRERIPEGSIIASWWDYGSWINDIGGRRTIVDEDHYIPYRIHLVARHLFLGDEVENIGFLKSYGVSHVMVTRKELNLIPEISWIGSDERYDRMGSVCEMSLDGWVKESNGMEFAYFGPNPPDSWIKGYLRIGNESFRPGQWRIGELKMILRRKGNDINLIGLSLTIHTNKGSFNMHPRRVLFRNMWRYASGSSIPGMVIIRAKGSDPRRWRAVYVPDAISDSFIVRLGLLGFKSNFFRQVYPGSKIGSHVMIWEVKYPEWAKGDRSYLGHDFTDRDLRISWSRGGIRIGSSKQEVKRAWHICWK